MNHAADTHADTLMTVAQPAADAGGFSVTVARNAEDLKALAPMWRRLEAEAGGVSFFQSYDWCRNAIEHVGDSGQSIYVCCAYDHGQLVGLLPLKLIKKRFRKILTGLAEPYQQYTEMLVAPGFSPVAIFAAMRHDIGRAGADYLHLGQVRQDGPLARAIADIAPATGEEKGAPFVDLTANENFGAYLQTIKPKTRKNMRNARNRLTKDGTLVHEVATEGKVLEEVISSTFEGRTDWLNRVGLTSRAFADAGFSEFLDRFRSPKTSGLTPIAMRLMHNGHPIAQQWGFIHANRYYAYISTFDTDYEESSPGKLHLGEVINACYEQGVETADFMVPNVPYKLTWATGITPVRDHVQVFSLMGFLYAQVWLGVVRPTIKASVHALPQDLRKKLFDLVLRRN